MLVILFPNISVGIGTYKMQGSIKSIEWIQGIPYCENIQLNKKIRFKSLHLQGDKKVFMKAFRKENLLKKAYFN